MTDAGLKSLASLTELVSLALDGTAVSDAGLESLGALPRLVNLSVGRTKVTDAGAARLQQIRAALQAKAAPAAGNGVRMPGAAIPALEILQ